MLCHHQHGAISIFRLSTHAMNDIGHLHRIGTLQPLQNLACRCQKCEVIGAITLHGLCGCLMESFVLCPPVPKLPLFPGIIGQKGLFNSRERDTHKPKTINSRRFTRPQPVRPASQEWPVCAVEHAPRSVSEKPKPPWDEGYQ